MKGASAIGGVFVVCAAVAAPLRAQTIALNVGTAPQLQVLPGATVAIPVEASLGVGANIASLSAGITWNTLAGGFSFSSLAVGASAWPIFNATTTGSALGSVSFATSNNANLPATNTVAIASFTASVGAMGIERGTRVFIAPTAATKVSPALDVLTTLRPRILDVCISEGRWGDVNNDNVVNIVDAQQMARRSVGLSVANAAATTLRGDVTNSGGAEPDIVDAQQTARFSVLLPASARLGTGTFTTPAVATHTLSPATPQSLAAGATLQVTHTPRTAGAADLTGCAGSTWETSNAAVATVNASGLVTGVAGGTTTITSRSLVNTTITATLSVTVTGGSPATQVVVTTQPTGAVSGAAFTTQPVVQIRNASNVLVATATNQVTATLTTGAGALLGTATVNAVGGIATFAGLRIDNAADQKRLTFSATGLTSALSSLFSVTPGALHSITVAIGSPTVALNGSTSATASGFDAALNPLGAVASPVWSTSNFRIARVTNAGAIQGIGSGTSNIVATSGAISGQSGLTVNAAAGGFAITMQNVTALTPSVQTAFTNAANRWAQVIRGDRADFGGVLGLDVSSCLGQPAGTTTVAQSTIDDILIYVSVGFIDGPNNILGSAGPCFTSGSGASVRTAIGTMRFEEVDLEGLETSGRLEAVILHEMGHVLGIGTLWQTMGLLPNPAPSTPDPAGDPAFIGVNGLWAFQNLGTGYVGSPVPVENCCGAGTRNGHWRESILSRELMTGFVSAAGQPNPLSPLTAASLIDQGFVVDVNQADNPPFFLRSSPPDINVFDFVFHLREGPMPPPIDIDAARRQIPSVRRDSATVRR